jgi:hypothetical protein
MADGLTAIPVYIRFDAHVGSVPRLGVFGASRRKVDRAVVRARTDPGFVRSTGGGQAFATDPGNEFTSEVRTLFLG